MTETLEIFKPGKPIKKVTIFYDTGANQTMGRSNTLDACATNITRTNVAVNLADSSVKYLTNAKLYKLRISRSSTEFEALGTPEIPSQKIFAYTLLKDWQRKYGVKQVRNTEDRVDIIIGTDNMSMFPKEVERREDIILFRSVLTGKLIVGGKHTSIIKATKAVTVNRLDVSEGMEGIFLKNCSYENVDCVAKVLDPMKEKQKEFADQKIKENIVFDQEIQGYKIKYIYNEGINSLTSNKEKI